MNKFSISLLSGLVASFLFSTANILDKYSLRFFEIFQYSLIRTFFNVIILFFISYFLEFTAIIKAAQYLLQNIGYVILSLILFSAGFLSFLYLISSNYLIKVLSILQFLSIILQIMIGIFIFHDNIKFLLFIPIAVIIFGIILLNNASLNLNFSKKIWFLIILNIIGFNYYSFYVTKISRYLSQYVENKLSASVVAIFFGETTTFVALTLVVIILLILNKLKIFKYKGFNSKFNMKNILWPFLTSLIIVSALVTLNIGFTYGYYSITSVLSNLSLLWTALFSHLFLKERLNKKQYSGVILIVLGLISFYMLK